MAKKPSISKHGKSRAWERAGARRGHAEALTGNAFEKGLRVADILPHKDLWAWVARHQRGTAQLRLHAEKLFIFSPEGTLITLIPIPEEHLEAYRAAKQIRTKK